MRRHLTTSLLVVLALLLALPAVSQARASRADSCPSSYSEPNDNNVDRVNHATLCLINYERAVRHMRPLRANGALANAAERHSRDMAQRNYFSHDTLGGGTFVSRIKAARYIQPNSAWSVGENLAWGTGSLGTPAATLNAWMHSSGHRANILNRSYRELGVGVVVAGGKTVYTTDFGLRR